MARVRTAQDIRRVAVVGTGYMGGGIAQSFALADTDVLLADVDVASTRRNQRTASATTDCAVAAVTSAMRIWPVQPSAKKR